MERCDLRRAKLPYGQGNKLTIEICFPFGAIGHAACTFDIPCWSYKRGGGTRDMVSDFYCNPRANVMEGDLRTRPLRVCRLVCARTVDTATNEAGQGKLKLHEGRDPCCTRLVLPEFH